MEETRVRTVSDISVDDALQMGRQIMATEVLSIGQGRGAGFDRMILMKKLVLLQQKSGIEFALFCSIVKTFAIKFAIQGTRIKPDNTVTIEGQEFTASGIAPLFEFTQNGKGTSQDQLTPTRLARLFATDAVEWARKNKYNPPMYLQEDIKVQGLPMEFHFLASCYASGASTYKTQLIQLGKNFDSKLGDAIQGFDKKNGFGMRMTWWFDHYDDGKLFGEFIEGTGSAQKRSVEKAREAKAKVEGIPKSAPKKDTPTI